MERVHLTRKAQPRIGPLRFAATGPEPRERLGYETRGVRRSGLVLPSFAFPALTCWANEYRRYATGHVSLPPYETKADVRDLARVRHARCDACASLQTLCQPGEAVLRQRYSLCMAPVIPTSRKRRETWGTPSSPSSRVLRYSRLAGDPFGFAQGRLFATPEERLRSG